jgi:hypothetical protein
VRSSNLSGSTYHLPPVGGPGQIGRGPEEELL